MSVVEAAAVSEDSAMREIVVVGEEDIVMMTVESPMGPSPAETAKESDSKAEAEGDCGSGVEDARHRIPSRPSNQRFSVHKPGVVFRNIYDLRIGRFNNDGLPLGCYVLLRCTFQVSGRLRTLPHDLYGLHHVLLLIHICIAER